MKEKGKKESREDRAKCKRLRLRVNRAKKIPRVGGHLLKFHCS